ncbi:MAG: hydratase [Acidimicrobiaceae bacterium]|nr:hydratase [Acidimicrobiaceae bacterium]
MATPELGERGRYLYGSTPPGGAVPCARTSALSEREIAEVVDLIARGRAERHAEAMPERLKTRDWGSVESVLLALDERIALPGAGWKIGAASEEIRRAEGLPSPSPGRIYRATVFASGADLGPELFINYRNIECEIAIELGADFPPREQPYTEADARAGVECMLPTLELGDTVFLDWYGASAYFGSCFDNGGGAALLEGTRTKAWEQIDLPNLEMRLYLNGRFIKSGFGRAAMGHPVTSLTWILNWLSRHGRTIHAGEVVSTGTCTGHCFAAPGDDVHAEFGELGVIDAHFSEGV